MSFTVHNVGEATGSGEPAPSQEQILAAMMADLGIQRMNELPLSDNVVGRAPITVSRTPVARSQPGPTHHWSGAVVESSDSDVTNLDSLRGGTLYKERVRDATSHRPQVQGGNHLERSSTGAQKTVTIAGTKMNARSFASTARARMQESAGSLRNELLSVGNSRNARRRRAKAQANAFEGRSTNGQEQRSSVNTTHRMISTIRAVINAPSAPAIGSTASRKSASSVMPNNVTVNTVVGPVRGQLQNSRFNPNNQASQSAPQALLATVGGLTTHKNAITILRDEKGGSNYVNTSAPAVDHGRERWARLREDGAIPQSARYRLYWSSIYDCYFLECRLDDGNMPINDAISDVTTAQVDSKNPMEVIYCASFEDNQKIYWFCFNQPYEAKEFVKLLLPKLEGGRNLIVPRLLPDYGPNKELDNTQSTSPGVESGSFGLLVELDNGISADVTELITSSNMSDMALLCLQHIDAVYEELKTIRGVPLLEHVACNTEGLSIESPSIDYFNSLEVIDSMESLLETFFNRSPAFFLMEDEIKSEVIKAFAAKILVMALDARDEAVEENQTDNSPTPTMDLLGMTLPQLLVETVEVANSATRRTTYNLQALLSLRATATTAPDLLFNPGPVVGDEPCGSAASHRSHGFGGGNVSAELITTQVLNTDVARGTTSVPNGATTSVQRSVGPQANQGFMASNHNVLSDYEHVLHTFPKLSVSENDRERGETVVYTMYDDAVEPVITSSTLMLGAVEQFETLQTEVQNEDVEGQTTEQSADTMDTTESFEPASTEPKAISSIGTLSEADKRLARGRAALQNSRFARSDDVTTTSIPAANSSQAAAHVQPQYPSADMGSLQAAYQLPFGHYMVPYGMPSLPGYPTAGSPLVPPGLVPFPNVAQAPIYVPMPLTANLPNNLHLRNDVHDPQGGVPLSDTTNQASTIRNDFKTKVYSTLVNASKKE